MIGRLIAGIIMTGLLSNCNAQDSAKFVVEKHTPFGVSYVKLTPEQVANYEMVILEPDFYNINEMEALKAAGPKIIAYVTLGEVDPNRWYYSLLEGEGFLGTNPNWNSSYLDLKDENVRRVILKRILPEIMAKKPDGLFLDTVDAVSPVTDRAHLKPFMVELIKEIRNEYPEIVIIQNAGLFLIEETKEHIDAFLTEALTSDYDFASGSYRVRPDDEIQDRLDYINHYVELSGKPYFIIEFAESKEQRQKIESKLDTLDRPYFITNIGLSELPTDPEAVTNDLKRE